MEERGLESLWFWEHTHIPVHFLNTPGRGLTLPEYYWQTYDVFVAMTLATAPLKKLSARNPSYYREMKRISEPDPPPLFYITDGEIEDWEICGKLERIAK